MAGGHPRTLMATALSFLRALWQNSVNKQKVLILQMMDESLSKIDIRKKFAKWNVCFLYNSYIEYMSKVMEIGNLGQLISLILNKKEAMTFLKAEEK